MDHQAGPSSGTVSGGTGRSKAWGAVGVGAILEGKRG